MASNEAKSLDDLDEECRNILKCKGTLEELYSSCRTTEISLQRLLRPHIPTSLYFKNVSDQIQSLKDILDGQTELVWLLFTDVQQCSDILQELKAAKDPDMVDEVIRLKDLLLGYCTELSELILKTVSTCRGFHLICKIVFDYLVEFYSSASE